MAKLLYASSHDKDMKYLVKADIPDSFFLIQKENNKYIYLDQREIGAFLESNQDPNIQCLALEQVLEESKKNEDEANTLQKLAFYLISKHEVENEIIEVPISLNLGIVDYLRSKGIILEPKDPLIPERSKKDSQEVACIKKALIGTQKAYRCIEKILKESKIVGDEIIYEEKVLTSEILKLESERAMLEEGLFDIEGMIISSGKQSAMPHHRGHGIIRPHQPIICDLFPWHRNSGYWADMTRTYIKGQPSEEILAIYESVKRAQQAGIDFAKAGVKNVDVHKKVEEVFLKDGFDIEGKGFIHGTGHGLGLDIHEQPYINKSAGDKVLEVGNVVTIEPGLYYPELGGVRIEDVVLITEDGCENLTNYPKEFVIL